MKKIALASLLLGVLAVAPAASAQCPPGSWLCADITVGTAPPPPPPVYVVPPPPPPPPPVYVVPPPPPRVYVVRPPVVIYTPPVQRYYLPPPTAYVGYGYGYTQPRRNTWVGVEGMGTFGLAPFAMGGVGAGLRVRGTGHFGFEALVGGLWGNDFNGDFRSEFPLALSMLFYANPQNRVQFYGLLGANTSLASVSYAGGNVAAHGGRLGDDYLYLGGQAGVGLEFQISRRFSVFTDVRGVLRTRVDGSQDANPEFSRTGPSGATQTTNTSIAATAQLGAALYF